MNAHNHGPNDGLGLACPERHVNGTQVGVCVLTNGASILAAAGLRNGSEERGTPAHDPVNHPSHYTTAQPSGIEPILITQHLSFCLGNVVKYCLRAGHKGDPVEDLKKARTYLDYEIARLEGRT